MALAGNFHGSEMMPAPLLLGGREGAGGSIPTPAHGSSSPKSASCQSVCGRPCPAPWPQKQNPDSLWKLPVLLASDAATTRWSGPSGMALPDSEWRRERGREERRKDEDRGRKHGRMKEGRRRGEGVSLSEWESPGHSLQTPLTPLGEKADKHQPSSKALTQESNQRLYPQLGRQAITPHLIHGTQLSSFWSSTKIQLASLQGLSSTSNKMSLLANYNSERKWVLSRIFTPLSQRNSTSPKLLREIVVLPVSSRKITEFTTTFRASFPDALPCLSNLEKGWASQMSSVWSLSLPPPWYQQSQCVHTPLPLEKNSFPLKDFLRSQRSRYVRQLLRRDMQWLSNSISQVPPRSRVVFKRWKTKPLLSVKPEAEHCKDLTKKNIHGATHLNRVILRRPSSEHSEMGPLGLMAVRNRQRERTKREMKEQMVSPEEKTLWAEWCPSQNSLSWSPSPQPLKMWLYVER